MLLTPRDADHVSLKPRSVCVSPNEGLPQITDHLLSESIALLLLQNLFSIKYVSIVHDSRILGLVVGIRIVDHQ